MKGFIYIAGTFETVVRSKCGGGRGWIDNDPHFWTEPPTWGICRNDLRKKANSGDYVFFVLPKSSHLPQMFFGYLQVDEKITHMEAFRRRDLLGSKRMRLRKNPNGNIIVNSEGQYHHADGGEHKHKFNKVKREYVVSNSENCKFLSVQKIKELAPYFVMTIKEILNWEGDGERPYDVISRYGKTIDQQQINEIINWLNQ